MSTLRDILKKIIAYIKEQIVRFYRFVTGSKSNQITGADIAAFASKRRKQAELMSKSLDASNDFWKDITPNITVLDTLIETAYSGEKVKIGDYDSLVELVLKDSPQYAVAQSLMDGSDGFIEDVRTTGPYSRLCMDSANRLSIMVTNINDRIELLSRFGKLDGDRVPKIADAFKDFIDQAKPPTYPMEGKNMTGQQILDALRDAKDNLKPTGKKSNLDHLINQMSSTYKAHYLSSLTDSVGMTLNELKDSSSELDKLSASFNKADLNLVENQQAVSALRESVTAIQRDILTITSLASEILKYRDDIDRIANVLRRVTKEISDRVNKIIDEKLLSRSTSEMLKKHNRTLHSF